MHLLRRSGNGICFFLGILLIISRTVFNSSDRTHVLLTPAVRKIHTSQHHHHLTQLQPPHSVFEATQRYFASMSHILFGMLPSALRSRFCRVTVGTFTESTRIRGPATVHELLLRTHRSLGMISSSYREDAGRSRFGRVFFSRHT